MALCNLLVNAIKFAPPGSTVEVGAKTIHEEVHLWIADQGPGIHHTDLPHIFDRFYRARTDPSSGSGLGLSIVKSVAEAHGGTITVENRLGKGSRFTLRIAAVPDSGSG